MKYMLLIYGAEGGWTDDERKACMVESMGICDQLAAQGKFLDASPLQSVTTATSVRVRGGRTLVTAGPFAETTEQLGGYFVLDLADLDEAIAVASRFPPATWGTVEIRPMITLDGLPPGRPVPARNEQAAAPYMLLCYDDEASWQAAGPEALRAAMAEATVNCRQLYEAGAFLSASPLHPPATATCVRVRDGKRTITDGPFAETTEQLGGFCVVEVPDDETAKMWAGRVAEGCGWPQEVREVT